MPHKEGDKGLDQLINNETPMWALMDSHDKSTSRLKKALIATNTAYKICKSVQEMEKLGTASPIFLWKCARGCCTGKFRTALF